MHIENQKRREREANVTCATCGKRFRVKPRNLPTAMYCSRKCQIQAKGNEGTHPEWLIEQELFATGIDYERQVQIGPYIADFVVNVGKIGIIIEVLGDYWHINPKIYFESKFASRRDKAWKKERRRIHYLREKGYEIYGLWESDIVQNPGVAIQEIVKYILGGKRPEKSGFEYLYRPTHAPEGGNIENSEVTISL
jgi:very-short-patch-repair endonuclease